MPSIADKSYFIADNFKGDQKNAKLPLKFGLLNSKLIGYPQKRYLFLTNCIDDT